MPIKFFEPVIPTAVSELNRLEDQFNAFEYTEAESIQKVYLTSFTMSEHGKEPMVILWCHYRSKKRSKSRSSSPKTTKG
jgi:hypothetical protein